MLSILPKVPVKRLQLYLWLFIWAMLCNCFLLEGEAFIESLVRGTTDTFFYTTIIYLNASILIPFFYTKKRYSLYINLSLLLLLVSSVFRVQLQHYYNNTLFVGQPVEKPVLFKTYSFIFFSHVLVFLTSIGFRLALDYFDIQYQKEQLQQKQALTELALLKAQVQPHFLFNTLNNIYSIAETESPATAEMIEQLASIMRYFTHEAQKTSILLETELDFIRNYIALETMRMRYPLETVIKTDIQKMVTISPMLLIPLVENVFKHGIDKRREENFLHLSIERKDDRLLVNIANNYYERQPNTKATGLSNLKSRLHLLYADAYTLKTYANSSTFYTHLNIPCA